ncbi:MAG: EamA family transporter RarD [Clostridia bacterium]|nr:EamA family transporter RarD [Clostridia bacterium]
MSKKHLLIAILCNLIWGFASIYWHMLGHIDSMFVLCSRIVFAAIFTLIIIYFQKKGSLLKSTFKDRNKMKYLIPSAIAISFNWGLFIWAMANNHMLDTSLGYFMSPLIVFAVSIIVFKEKSTGLKLAAILIALAGILISLIMYKALPIIGLALAFSFTIYGTLKKHVNVEPSISICIESLLLTPIAIGVIYFTMGADIQALVVPRDVLLLMGTGILTGVPLILYASAVNNLPYIAVGFTQYISPTITMFVGLFYGEVFTPEKTVLLLFVLVSIIVYSVGVVRDGRKLKEGNSHVSSIDN